MKALARALRDPSSVASLDAAGWMDLLTAARAEQLIASLALRVEGQPVPPRAAEILADARAAAEQGRVRALWEAEMAWRALAPLDVPVVLLKGTAFVAADMEAGQGRFIGDLDILVPRDRLDEVEQALLGVGWVWVKDNPYDALYYRQWMHELPPMIHAERDRMIDVHHTILPLTARPKPDADALLADAVAIGDDLWTLSPEDRVIHAAAHMLADGDLQGGLRNLWDIHCLLHDIDRSTLDRRAARHGLRAHVRQAQRLAGALYGGGAALTPWDRIVRARLLARDGWGRETRKLLVFAFYLRSHWLRMPPLMLARHLWTKWRKGHRPR